MILMMNRNMEPCTGMHSAKFLLVSEESDLDILKGIENVFKTGIYVKIDGVWQDSFKTRDWLVKAEHCIFEQLRRKEIEKSEREGFVPGV